MKPYGINSKQSGSVKYDFDDSRKARRWSGRNRSVSPKAPLQKVWKKRARRVSREAVQNAEG